MRYLPLSSDERKKILDVCEVGSLDELISQVPEKLRLKKLLDLDKPLSELELIKHLGGLAEKSSAAKMTSFLGQGCYDHFYPKVIDQISNRGEFLTAYTPYQPEVSQGTLQIIFEYQSMMASLTGMEVSNASLYDGATSVVEGVLMAARLQSLKKGRVLVSEGTFPRYRQVLESYLEPLGFTLELWKADASSQCSVASTALAAASSEPIAAVVMQSPNQWGLIEDFSQLSSAATQLKTKSIAAITHMHSMALFESPGALGVDIVTGEAQSFGIPVGFGGPHLGILCCRKSDIRQMPGRLVGATVDSRGDRAFCVTLSTREQHIRREKATSNICSNQNFMATRSCLYLTLMGTEGLQKSAQLCRSKAYHFRGAVKEIFAKGNSDLKVLEGELLNEVTILIPAGRNLWTEQLHAAGVQAKMLAGVAVPACIASPFVSGITFAFTEHHSTEEISNLTQLVAEQI